MPLITAKLANITDLHSYLPHLQYKKNVINIQYNVVVLALIINAVNH